MSNHMEGLIEKTQQTFIRLILGIGVGFLLFVVLCWAGWHGYTLFESKDLIRRAKVYSRSADLRNAALSAQRALQLNPRNIEAVRLLADLAEASADRRALDWRRRVIELNPQSSEDAIALVNCALQFGDITSAERGLASVSADTPQTAEYEAAKARIAEAKKEFTDAEKFWAEAVRLAKGDKRYQLPFAISLLRANDVAKRERALTILQELRSDVKQRIPATRALIADSATHGVMTNRLTDLARDLQNYPEATFNDRLLYLGFLRQLHDPQYTVYLTSLEEMAAAKPTELASLLSWMNASGMSLLGIDYASTLSSEQRNRWPVNLALAQAHEKIADWGSLEKAVKGCDWGQYEFLRHAYLARALRGQNKSVACGREWLSAQKEAGNQVSALRTLLQVASDWGWRDESMQLLWSLSSQPEARTEALQQLYKRYLEAGDTPALYRVLVKLAELNPADLDLQNNLAQVALLLHVDVDRARRLISDVYKKQQSNAAYATTFAFSLYTKGDAQAALQVMRGLNDEQRQDPPIAAYYGLFLTAVGEADQAQEYLKRGASAKLLPEEKALLSNAERVLR